MKYYLLIRRILNLKFILLILAAWLVITVISVILAINKQKHFNNHPLLTEDMDIKEAISLMGTSYDKKKGEDYEEYEWKIMNKQFRGINDVVIHVKDNKIVEIIKQRKSF